MTNSVKVRALGVADPCALNGILYELRRDADLGADVAELGDYAEEEFVLLFVEVAGQTRALFGLQGYVCVRDFGDWAEEEYDGEEEDEGGDAKVGPLHAGKVARIGGGEEHPRGEKGRHDGPDRLE